MKKVKIANRDMSISKISEKILKISEDYEKAKEEDNKELMEELKKEYEYQKAVLNASENFFAKYDEKEMPGSRAGCSDAGGAACGLPQHRAFFGSAVGDGAVFRAGAEHGRRTFYWV